MTRAYRKSRPGSKQAAASRGGKKCGPQEPPLEFQLDRHAMVDLLKDSLHSFAIEIGVMMAGKMLEDEIEQLCGPRYVHCEDREMTRFGRQQGYAILGGQKVHLDRPRARYVDGRGEVPLKHYEHMQDPQAMPEAVLRRLIRGVSCRDYEAVVDLAREGFGVKKSSVSRGFVKASAADVKALTSRRFEGVRFVAILIDGVEYAGETMVCSMGMTEKGEKRVLGLRQGATENAEVVTSLLEELCQRGIDTKQPTLFVLDGAKALHAAVKRVWGRKAIIQRCQVHKKRNVQAHVPKKHWPEILRELNAAYYETDYQAAQQRLQATARRLGRISPDAAGSLREGMDETLTVIKLGLSPLLRRTLATTNPIESAFHVARTVTSRVKRWRDGDMRQRWCVAGLLKAETRFRRVRGFRQISLLTKALDQQLVDSNKKAG